MPRKRPRKRIAAGRPRPRAPSGANQVRTYDFVFDRCANGQQLKCLTVADEWTREGLAIEVDGRIRSARVIEVLSRLVSERGAPLYLRSDNGPEFVSRALLGWIASMGMSTALIDPGKPWQNGTGESFNGKFRDECLSLEWFRSRAEAKVVIERWRRHYNPRRRHSSICYQSPINHERTQLSPFARIRDRQRNQGNSIPLGVPMEGTFGGVPVLRGARRTTWPSCARTRSCSRG
jgi:putative transposase